MMQRSVRNFSLILILVAATAPFTQAFGQSSTGATTTSAPATPSGVTGTDPVPPPNGPPKPPSTSVSWLTTMVVILSGVGIR